ncbi:ABC transporter substrate-binding protein [Streptomyces sp. NPDC059814]|uniref:ABC transporter substrate-binding protein n=1 Tax=Streptomyces sp. NPDC059814 TaxID=3346959 RepID=UPI00365D710F
MSPLHTPTAAGRAMDRFGEALDAVVVEPPGRQNAAALVLLAGEGETATTHTVLNSLLHSLRKRLLADSAGLAPHAVIRPSAEYQAGPVTLLYEHITQDLIEAMPVGTGKLRFPSYWLLRDIVVGVEPAESGAGRAREVRRAAYAEHLRRTGRGRLRDQLREQASGWAQPVKFLVDLWMDWLAEPWYGYRIGRRMLRARNRNWYATWAQQLHGDPVRNFFASVQDLAPGGRNADPEVVENALLRALLSDLDGALRHRMLSPWRRRRVTRFVLFVEDAGPVDRGPSDARPGGPDRNRLQRFLAEYLVAAEKLGSRSTLVVGCVQPEFAVELAVEPQADFEGAAEALRSGMRSRNGLVAVAVPVRPEAEVAEWSADRHPKIMTRVFRWGPVAGIALRCVTAAAVGAGLIGGWYFAGFSLFDEKCPSNQFENDYGPGCLGLSDGTEAQRFDGMAKGFGDLFAKIADGNGTAEELAKEKGREVRTVVYFGPMSGNAADLGGSLAELHGVALAQHENNVLADRDIRSVGLRVLLANAGPGFKAARRVANKVVERTDEERIAGVVGFGQSRPETHDAMQAFAEKHISMIGTSATADTMVENNAASDLYYQLAPNNRRQAHIMKAFLKGQPGVLPKRTAGSNSMAIVVSNPKDEYSRNLSDDFIKVFADGEPLPMRYVPSRIGSLGGLAKDVCDKIRSRNMPIVWTARAQELVVFLGKFKDTPCNEQATPLTVLGGDDVTNAMLDEDRPTLNQGLSLYHVMLAAPRGADTYRSGDFVASYKKFYKGEKSNDKMLQDSHAALGYDGVKVLAHAIERAYIAGEGFDKSAVSVSLHDDFKGDFSGVTGVIDFSDDSRVPVNKAIYVVRDSDPSSSGSAGGSESSYSVVLKCGNFGDGKDNLTRWGPEGDTSKYPCPDDRHPSDPAT